jgi:hypothetical protein
VTAEPAVMLTSAGLDALEAYYTAEPAPPCRVCGCPLRCVDSGGTSAAKWACSSPAASQIGAQDWRKALDHHKRSIWHDRRPGDSRVLALITEVRFRREQAAP